MRQSRQGRAAPGPAQDVLTLRRVEVVRTYLALDDPAQFRPAQRGQADAALRIERRAPCPLDLYRRLYKEVGEQWYWHERLQWSDQQLAGHLASPGVAVWELLVDDESAGYFELQQDDDGDVEIVYFGLRPAFFGRGLGGVLLTRAVREAWAFGARRVWLHTCTLDSDRALPGYQARGFRPYGTQRLEVQIEGTEILAERVLTEAPRRP